MSPIEGREAPALPSLTPKLLTVLREGYSARDFRADAIAGLTVAIVALPLSMAIAIACGLSPDRGLYTAIVGGFLISALGGSRYQIGGPAGAFIVLIAGIVQAHGYDGLVLATIMAGLMMIAVGFLRLGGYIRYIPFPVTVGFTAGIAVIIFASQIKELLGLAIEKEPAALLPKLAAIWSSLPTASGPTMLVAGLSVLMILAFRRWRPSWPGLLITVAVAALVAWLLGLDIGTIGSRFGGVPSSLPSPSLPPVSLARLAELLPAALAIALLGSIESLLSAVVADGMSGGRHRSDMELIAQGAANIASVLFGGVPVTGTIARTATNVRAGARGPVSGMLHAVYLLAFMVVAAPLAAYIPLAALGAVLAVVAWNMAEKHEFAALLRTSRADAVILLTTFVLTILVDLTIAIGVGVVLGAFVFMHRMATSVEVAGLAPPSEQDGADPVEPEFPEGDVLVYRLTGAFFFAAAGNVSVLLERLPIPPRAFIFDFRDVPLADSSAAKSLERFAHRLHKAGAVFVITGANAQVRQMFQRAGLGQPLVLYAEDLRSARELIHLRGLA
ncbi:SulP family inorganic anion transporter [Rhabdaerophilum sp. SD176]|uniref:SulP family inorganic anion transporter n=1 Tax=Rhabdaerophilum sp. SD176 TaxID=2983548 RepID=UPI0024E030F6|nr:SulP family inorganic anion transporter [Rhabdaerophilum sp. SD176]